jgi:hypothetical protein
MNYLFGWNLIPKYNVSYFRYSFRDKRKIRLGQLKNFPVINNQDSTLKVYVR